MHQLQGKAHAAEKLAFLHLGIACCYEAANVILGRFHGQ
jgi:hypothetical protein